MPLMSSACENPSANGLLRGLASVEAWNIWKICPPVWFAAYYLRLLFRFWNKVLACIYRRVHPTPQSSATCSDDLVPLITLHIAMSMLTPLDGRFGAYIFRS